ncbi:MAG: isoprenyl transferase [Oscillospiraceae bacterium]|nr:isoprenyl transferase [Oscillospiraceae bacterium]
MKLFKRNSKAEEITNLPRHIGIIMDGNGRWAKKRSMPRTAGHAAGAETFRRIATYCKNIGIEYLTVYAFSTENWKRPAEEVEAIMGLLDKYLLEAIDQMERDKVKMRFFGDTSVLSEALQEKIRQTNEISDRIDGCQVNICLNYGGRDEIIRAVKKYAAEVAEGRENDITEGEFSSYLFSAGVPDPDLIIRPSGEYRISNFLMWQSAYSEFYFTDTLWPDFKEKDLDEALRAYAQRDRRYGGVKKGSGK